MTQPRPYQVNATELARRWTELIRPRLFRRAQAATDPTALFIGAQPGAGKTQTAARITARYGRPFVWIDSDELRKFHPQFRDIMRADPLRMAVLTNQAASTWVQMAITEARAAGYDVLIENSFHTPDVVLAEAARFKDAGYTTHAVALAVPGRDSRLGAGPRYVDAAAAVINSAPLSRNRLLARAGTVLAAVATTWWFPGVADAVVAPGGCHGYNQCSACSGSKCTRSDCRGGYFGCESGSQCWTTCAYVGSTLVKITCCDWGYTGGDCICRSIDGSC